MNVRTILSRKQNLLLKNFYWFNSSNDNHLFEWAFNVAYLFVSMCWNIYVLILHKKYQRKKIKFVDRFLHAKLNFSSRKTAKRKLTGYWKVSHLKQFTCCRCWNDWGQLLNPTNFFYIRHFLPPDVEFVWFSN